MIAVLGDVLVDVLASIDRPLAYASDTPAVITMNPGGSAAGTAAWLAYLGHPVRLLGSVGDDELAGVARTGLGGVDLRLQRHSTARTGFCVVIINDTAERTMLPDAGANIWWQFDPADLDGISHLHVSAYSVYRESTRPHAFAALDRARAMGVSTSLDLASVAPMLAAREAAAHAMALSDVVFANADEASAFTGCSDPLDALECLVREVRVAVVKTGPHGCLAASDDSRVAVAALHVNVLDTTGAGDAFSAGFLPAWLAGSSLETSVHEGQSVAARTITRVGAGPPPPDRTGHTDPPTRGRGPA